MQTVKIKTKLTSKRLYYMRLGASDFQEQQIQLKYFGTRMKKKKKTLISAETISKNG
jgi:hypothetical protein